MSKIEYRKNSVNLSKYQKLISGTIFTFFGAFSVAFISCSVFAPQSTTNADTMIFNVGTSDYSASVSSADNVEITVAATPSGTVGIARDTITTTTNNPEGYKLYFSMEQAQDYDSTHKGNALYQDGNSTSSNFLSPTTGTISAPATLADNSWGFALLGGASRQTGVPDTFSNFDPVYVDSNGNSSDGSTGQIINPSNKFAAVPLRSAATIVQEKDTATSSSGDQLAVYYGVNANTALASGSYIGTVNYFVMADSSASLADLMSLSPSTIDSLGGQELTLATSLHTNYNFSNSDIVVTLTDTNDSTNTGTCTVTNVSTESGSVIAKCTTPALSVGTYNVTLSIPTYGKTYEKEIVVEAQAPTFWNIQYMQDMTPEICAAVTTPDKTAAQTDVDGSHHGDTAYVAQRTLYDYRGKDGTGNKDNKVTPDSANAKSYMVRKLADGNCWMTQNLEIPLASGTTIEASYNTTASAYSFTPSAACSGNGDCSMNVNTGPGNGTYYYSWYAATAETGTRADVNTDTSASICPVGWRLPANYTIDSSKSYGSMTNAYSFTTNGANNSQNHVAQLESAPLNFARSGYYNNGGLSTSGADGYYWSSTAYTTAARAYDFYYNTSNTYPQHNASNSNGFTVRCVAQ